MGKHITLQNSQRKELKRLARQHTQNGLTVRRACALLSLDRGEDIEDIALFLFLHSSTIYKWIEEFNNNDIGETDPMDHFLKPLFMKRYKGRDGKLTLSQQRQLVEHFRENLARDINCVIEYIRKEFFIIYSRSGCIKLMNRLGFSYEKPKHIPKLPSEEEQQKQIDEYNKLKESLPEDEVIVFGDAVHPTHQSKPVNCWVYSKDKVAIPANTGRKRLNILGSLCLEDGGFTFVSDEVINAESVINMIKNLEMKYPNKRKIHYIVDNGRYFHAKMVKEYQEKAKSRVQFHFLPPYSPHLNPIERLWLLMHKHITHNRHYEKFNDFHDAVYGFFRKTLAENWNNFCDTVTDNFCVIKPKNFRLVQ